jgi:DNA (cytosine-5)-methyltransferase 1
MAGRRKPCADDFLYVEVVRIAKMVRPSVFILENVVGFASKIVIERGQMTALRDLKRRLREIFAYVDHKILNALDHGVHQSRKRVIVIASDAPIRFPVPHPDHDTSIERLLQPHKDVRDPFYWMEPHKVDYYLKRKLERPAYVRFVNVKTYSNTLRAGYYKSRAAEALVRSGKRLRMFTELELARIQSFPDSYVFKGSHTVRCTQICNAIPPLLACAIVTSQL